MPFTFTSCWKKRFGLGGVACVALLGFTSRVLAQNVTINCQTGCPNNVAAAIATITANSGVINNLTIDDNPGSGTPINNLSGLSVLTSLTGNLNVRRLGQNGATVSDLSGLSNLGSVAGSVTIGGTAANANPALTSVALSGLTSIGAVLNVQHNNNAAAFTFPLLSSVATNLTLANNGSVGSLAKTIGFPALTSIGGSLTVQNNGTGVSSIDFSNLNSIGSNASFNNNTTNSTTASVHLGALGSVNGSLTLTRVAGTLTLNGLNIAGNLTFSNNTSLATLSTIGTVTVNGTLSIQNNPALTQINLPTPFGGPTGNVTITGNTSLQTVYLGLTNVTGNVTIQNNGTGVTTLDLSDLVNVGANLSLSNTAANGVTAHIDLSALNNVGTNATFTRTAGTINAPNLANVGGSLTLTLNSTLVSFDASFAALTTVGGNLVIQNNPQLSTCCRILCDLVVNGIKNISGNAPGCATMANINTTCTASLCPPPQTRQTDPGECAYTGGLDDNLNCSVPMISYNLSGATVGGPYADLSGIVFNLGTTTIAATATTASPATTATCSFTITVEDNEPPTVTCPTPDNPYETDPGFCYTSLEFAANAEDNCGVDTIIYEVDGDGITFPYEFPVGTTTVVVTVTDINGNTATCTFTVEVEDNEAPDVTCPSDATVTAGMGECYYTVTGTEFDPTAIADNCSVSSVNYILNGSTEGAGSNTLAGEALYKGLTMITWIVTDDSGNTVTCSFMVEIEVDDNEPPTVICPTPDNPYETDPGFCYTSLEFAADAEDNCGVDTIIYEVDGGGITFPYEFPVGTTTVVVTVTDINGNTATCTFTVEVEDNEAPEILCPEDVTISTDPDTCLYMHVGIEWDAEATDNCEASIAYELDGTTSGSGTSLDGVAFNFGATIVTWTATDGSGNSTQCSFSVTVVDEVAPVVISTTYGLPPGENPDIDDYECGDIVIVLIDSGCSALQTVTRPVWEDNCFNPVVRAQSANNGVTLSVAPGMPGYVTGNFPTGITTITFTGTDAANNTGTCTLNIWVKEPIPPVITSCPIDITVEAAPDSCVKTLTFTPTATDNCGPVTFAYSTGGDPITLPYAFPVGETSVLVEAIDLSGNIATCLFSIVVSDTQPPTITCPENVTAPAEPGECFASVTFEADASDNCMLSLLTYCCDIISPFDFPVGTTTVVATAVDNSGNSKTCTFTVTVTEEVPPVFSACPTEAINLGCNPEVLPDDETAVAEAGDVTDNCELDSVTAIARDIEVDGCIRTQVWTVTATDKSGNTATCEVVYTWTEVTAPILAGLPESAYLGCNLTALPTCDDGVTATNECGVVEVNCEEGDITIDGCLRAQTFTYTAMACDLTTTEEVTFTWTVDEEAPEFATCPDEVIYLGCNPEELPDEDLAIEHAGAVLDDCGVAEVSAEGGDIVADGCLRTQVWVVTAEDTCGNTASCEVVFTWTEDTESPTFASCPTAPVDLGCNPAVPTADSAIARAGAVTDNCGGTPTVTASGGAVSGTGCARTQVWTVTATDVCGNTGTCAVTFTWRVDTEGPTFASCPTAPVDLGCNPAVPTADSAIARAGAVTDNCGGTPTVTASGGAVSGTGCARAQVWTVTATDACGNTGTCAVTFTWRVDTEAPVFAECPENVIDLGCNPDVLPDEALAIEHAGEVSDNCDVVNLFAEGDESEGECAKMQVWTVYAVDACGNEAPCVVTFVWTEGSEGLSITCPSTQTLALGAGCSATLPDYRDSATVSLGCATSGSVVQTPAPGTSVSGIGSMTVTLSVTDGCGGSAFCTFTVNKVDNIPPAVVCPATQNLTLGVACSAELPDYTILATATDNCTTPVILTQSPPAGSTVAGAGPMTITLTAGDASANKSTCTFTVNKIDAIPPTFTFMPSNVTVQCSNLAAAGRPSATDACGTVTIDSIDVITPGSCPDARTIVRTWRATDGSGNTVTFTQVITVVDTQAPNFVGVADITVQCYALPDLALPTATDNCDADVAVTFNGQTRTNGSCPNQYFLTRRWTAADNCGNTRSISQRITVIDTNRPFFTSFPANVTIQCSDPTPPLASPTASDSCGTASVVYVGQTITTGTCANNFTIRRTWRATDQCGNSTVQTQLIQVVDTTPPTFTSVPANVTITCPSPLPPVGTPTATDNCMGAVSIVYLGQTASGSCPSGHTVTRTWRATDVCGNSTTAVQVITVLPPAFGPDEGAEDREQAQSQPQAPVWDDDRLLTLQPNPTTDRVLIGLGSFAGERVVVSIHNDIGQLIWERAVDVVPDLLLPVSLRESGAKAGLYTVSVRSSGRVVAKRLVLIE